MRRFVPLALWGVILLASTAALAWLLRGERAPRADSAESAISRPGERSGEIGVSASAPDSGLGVSPSVAIVEGAAGAPSSTAEAADARAPVDRGVAVRVALEGGLRDAETVRAWLVTGASARIRWDRSRGLLRERARRGESFALDADGRAWIPRQTRPYRIAIDGDEHWGWRDVEPDLAEVVVEAAWCPPLVVRVVDASGAPAADVPLEVRLTEGPHDARFLVASDASGAVRISDALAAAGSDRTWSALGGLDAGEVRVQVQAPVGPVVAKHALRAALQRPMEMRLPPAGRVEIHVRTPDGKPYEALHGVLEARQITGSSDAPGAPHHGDGVMWHLEFEGSVAVLPTVGLHRAFEIGLDVDGVPSTRTRRVEGPRAAGETVVTQLVPHESMRVVVARVLREGRPQPGESLHGRLETPDGATAPVPRSPTTDADACAAVWIPDAWGPEGRWSLVLTSREDPELAARVDFARDLPNGRFDAGDVALAPAPLLVAGTVRDDAGRPVRAAMVFVAPAGVAGGFAGEAWSLPPHATDARGRFAVNARVPGDGQVEVWARGGGHAAAGRARALRGAEDVEVPVVRLGTLEVTLLAPPAAIHVASDFEVRASRSGEEGGPPRAERSTRRKVVPDATELRFALDRLAPGAYDVAVGYRGVPLPGRDAIAIAGGADAAATIDLRPLLHVIAIAARDEEGAPLQRCSFRWRASGTEDWSGTIHPEDSVARVVTPALPVDVKIFSPDRETQTLLGVAQDREVRLAAARRVRLVVTGARLVPAESRFVSVKRASEPRGALHALDERGEVELGLPSGAYVAAVGIGSEEDLALLLGGVGVEQAFTVAPGGGEQIVVLDVLSRAYERALAKQPPR